MIKGQKIITNNFSETQQLGFEFAKTLKAGDVIGLYGDLGCGKTTFAQGVAIGLGVTQRIISPTFIIMRSYAIESGNFYHVDLYRTETKHDVESLGLIEIMNDPQNIVVIEWAEKITELLPEKRINIYFKYVDDEKRQIVFE